MAAPMHVRISTRHHSPARFPPSLSQHFMFSSALPVAHLSHTCASYNAREAVYVANRTCVLPASSRAKQASVAMSRAPQPSVPVQLLRWPRCKSPCLAQTLVVHAPVRPDPAAGTGCVNSGEAGDPASGSPLLEGPRRRSDRPSSSTVTDTRGERCRCSCHNKRA